MNIRELSLILEHVTVTSAFGTTERVFGGSEIVADGSNFLLLTTNTALDLLRTSTYIYCFSVSFTVSASQQWWVHTICTVRDNVMLRLCWFLFENEAQDIYNAMFSLLRAKLKTWQFSFVICDDIALQTNAYKNIFGVEIALSVHQNVNNITRLAITHMQAFRQHPQHWDQFRRIIKLCIGLQLVPRSLILRAFYVVKKEAMECHNIVFDPLWPIIEIIATPPLKFLLSGCAEKTNYVRETLMKEMNQVCIQHQNSAQALIGKILRMVTNTIEDQHLLRIGRRPLRARPSRICKPLSENSQIVVLTRGLTRPSMNIDFLILNFLQEVSDIVARHSSSYDNSFFN